jgi:hypothetical protein
VHYIKLDQTMPDPYGKAIWVPLIQAATPFDTKESAEGVRRLVSNASGVIYDDKEECWYVVKVADTEKHNCWAVLCRNEKHGNGGYPIPLALVEGDADIRGSIHDPFVVQCRWGCKEESTYSASHIHNWPLTLPEGWEPHPHFRNL